MLTGMIYRVSFRERELKSQVGKALRSQQRDSGSRGLLCAAFGCCRSTTLNTRVPGDLPRKQMDDRVLLLLTS